MLGGFCKGLLASVYLHPDCKSPARGVISVSACCFWPEELDVFAVFSAEISMGPARCRGQWSNTVKNPLVLGVPGGSHFHSALRG